MRFRWKRNAGVLALLAVIPGLATIIQGDQSRDMKAQLARGKKLFVHRWEPGDALSPAGDGLGPLYNAVSCAACHHQAGMGGSGPISNNVDLLNVAGTAPADPATLAVFTDRLARLHRGFASPNGTLRSIVLHRNGVSSAYAPLRKGLLAMAVEAESSRDLQAGVSELLRAASPEIVFRHTQRNSPSLFGLGLLDRVSRKTLGRTTEQQARKYPEVSGRLAPSAGGDGVGRFGWRAQSSSLREFVLGACANELGLEVPGHRQAIDPTDSRDGPSMDMSEEQCRDLVTYVASLPAPVRLAPSDAEQRDLAEHGQQVFESVGCVACHVENIEPARGSYTDLVLHDMGPGLDDPLPSTFRPDPPPNSYYGAPVSTGSSISPKERTARREWRTPPLWGVADTAPYLHDGRAATLTEAIVAHGGEAQNTTVRFLQLSTADRLALLTFLGTLPAPQGPDNTKSIARHF